MKGVGRFELRISDEDRARLRTLAARTCRTETDVLRFLIRQAQLSQANDIPPLTVSPRAVERGRLALTAA